MPRYALRSLFVLGLAAVVTTIVGAQAPPQNSDDLDKLTAKVVVKIVESQHMAKPTIGDETAVKWCKTFLKDLDPPKYYFLKADIDEFMAEATTLDDKIREGDIAFARKVYDRFLKRSDERYAKSVEYLDKPMDFTVDEAITDDPEKMDWPTTADQANERLRKRLKFQLLVEKVAKEPLPESIKKVKSRQKDLNRYAHQVNSSDLLELYLSSLTRTFDPHSSYLSKTSYDDLVNTQLHLQLTGIGALLESVDGVPTIKELVPKGPADKDGRIQEEDKILGVQDEKGEETSFVEKRLSDVVKQIRGKEGTKVRLIIQPKGTTEKKIYEITRAKIELADEHARGQVITTKADGKDLKIGVIRVPTFYGDAQALGRGDDNAVSVTKDCRTLLDGFKKGNVDAVMIDLRENGGGLLSEAISLSGLFIDKGPVVQVKDARGVQVYDDGDEGTAWAGPLAVLIDHRSASASEIFAGVIKDYGRGVIIGGSHTFGKGTVQTIERLNDARGLRSLPDMGALKITIQQFYRANGESTQVQGVSPDVKIPSFEDQLSDELEGKLDNSLKFDKVDAVPHDQFNRIPADLIGRLDARSEARRKDNDKFKKLETSIKRALDRKSKHLISLNETKYRAEIGIEEEELNEAAKEKKKRKKYDNHPAWESNYINDEIVNIVTDYLTIGSKVIAAAPVRVDAAAKP